MTGNTEERIIRQFERQLTAIANRIERQSRVNMEELQRQSLQLAERQLGQFVEQWVGNWLQQGLSGPSSGETFSSFAALSQPPSGQDTALLQQRQLNQSRRNQ